MPRVTAPPTIVREQVSATAQGLITQNFDRQGVGTVSLLIDGTVYFMLVGLVPGDIVTNISIVVQAAGSGVTLSKVGLYDKTGVRLALSADQGTAWQSASLKTVAMISPYTVLTKDGYYVAVVSKASTTLPTLLRGVNTTTAATAIGSGVATLGTLAAQTDLPATATIVATSPIGCWAGIS